MGALRDFFFGPSIFSPPPKAELKGVEFTDSHGNGFQSNVVTVRTVSYTTEAASLGSYATMYRRQPAVRAAVDFLGRNIGQLNPKVYERVSSTDRIEVGDHPLARCLRNPNPVTTRFAHLRDTVTDLAIYDRAYWRKMRTNSRVSVVRIPPEHLDTTTNRAGQTIYRLRNTGDELSRRDLIIFHGYSPDGGLGVSPLETLRRVLAEEAAAVANREGMWRNSTQQSGFIYRPETAPDWSDDARSRFRQDFEASFGGTSNAGRIPILEEGMRFDASKFSAPTDDYIAGRRLTYEEVAIAYGIPPVILGMGPETKSNAESFHRQVYQDVLGPWLRMLQDEIELQLLPEFERFNAAGSVYVEFNLKEKLRGAFEEEQRAITTGVGVPHMTVNEGRAVQNLPRIDAEWADVPVQPLNVLYGGQPAVTVPTATPGTAAAPRPTFKAAPPAVLRRRERAAKEHEEFFRRYFERQERTVTAAKAADDRERWDRELTADLYALAVTLTGTTGRLAARQVGGVYDEPRTYAYILENARLAATGINAQTFEMLAAAEDADAIREVFEQSKNARAEQIALGRATTLINFARAEAAKHSTERDGRTRTKTWVVTSRKSRHPELNGETVPVGELFSNGLMWPGDGAAGSADDVAGCKCLLDLN